MPYDPFDENWQDYNEQSWENLNENEQDKYTILEQKFNTFWEDIRISMGLYHHGGSTICLYDALKMSSSIEQIFKDLVNTYPPLSQEEFLNDNSLLDDIKKQRHEIIVMLQFPTTYHILLDLEERKRDASNSEDLEEIAKLDSYIDGFFKWINSKEFSSGEV